MTVVVVLFDVMYHVDNSEHSLDHIKSVMLMVQIVVLLVSKKNKIPPKFL